MLSRKARSRQSESGFVLLAVICLTVLLLIALAVAAPRVAQSIQRQKELETIQRGDQYREAIRLYYKKFGHYPTSVKQLLNTNDIRFLRRKYADPLTGKDDWKPVCYGQAHVRPLGFFGKPLSAVGGIAAAGVGVASGGMYAITPSSTDANGDSTSSDNSSDSGSSGFGSSTGSNSSGGIFGNTAGDSGAQSPFGGGSGMFSGQSGFGSNTGTSPATGMSGLESTGATGLGSTSSGSSLFGSSDSDATTFGGGCMIVGFTLPVKKPSLIDYMEQDAYNKWEFNYDPMADRQQAVNLLGGGANMNNSSDATTVNPLGGSDGSSNSGFGSTSTGFGSSNTGFGSSATGSPGTTPNTGTSPNGSSDSSPSPLASPITPDGSPNSPQ